MTVEFDLDDIKPSALKRLLKQALIRSDDNKKANKDKAHEEEDAEKEDIADLMEERRGKKPDTDLPSEIADKMKDDADKKKDSKADPDDSKAKKGKKPFPFKKKK